MILRRRKPRLTVHTNVQNTNNFYHIAGLLAIEDHVTASVKFSVAIPNIAAILSCKRIGGQLLKGRIQYSKIQIALFASSMFQSVAANFF